MKALEQFRWEKINQVFSIVMVLDRDLRIILSSPILRKHLPGTTDAPLLFEQFDCIRPRAAMTFDAIAEMSDSLFLYIAKDKSFAIRGQMILDDDSGESLLIFVGGPWLSWLSSNRPELSLGIADFSPQDSQLDQLFYMQTERAMVQDLEKLTAELKAANAEASEAQATKAAFFAQMSHEMRTPLNGIISALSLLDAEQLPGQSGDLLRMARESSANLLEVINYVMDVSKLEGGGDEVEAQTFDLTELVDSIIKILEARAVEKHLQLSARVASDLATHYRGDVGRIRQCLLNLITNAIKFTTEGRVSVTVRNASSSGDRLYFEVRDTGPGISAEDQQRIFEPFVSLSDNCYSQREAGSGLGLDIVRRNVACMSGKLGLNSAPGIGATFWMELPLAEVEAAATGEPTPEIRESGSLAPLRGRILLVDDNETNLVLGAMILEALGLDIRRASSGKAAIEMTRKDTPDLILMDINMPEMDGFEATRRLREEFPPDQLPIVALTAFASSVERDKAREAGMNDYLTKPINRDEMHHVLQGLLAGASKNDSTEVTSSPAPADTGDVATLDVTTIDTLREQIGHDNLKIVIGKFVDESTTRWEALAGATSAEIMAREAHTLGSTCRSFGLPGLGDEFYELEQLAKQGATPANAEGLEKLGELLRRGVAVLGERVGVR